MDIKHEVARSLLSIEAVFLRPQEPFTWASGIKSPHLLRQPPHPDRARGA